MVREVKLVRPIGAALVAAFIITSAGACRKQVPVAPLAPAPRAQEAASPAAPPEPVRAQAAPAKTAPEATPASSSPAPRRRGSLNERLAGELADVLFAYDQSMLGPESQRMLHSNASALQSILADFPSVQILLEGHCDERGSAEYNLGLGDRRGTTVKTYLTQLGLPDERFRVLSLGKERPQCSDSTEECRSRNRRVRFAAAE
jgi:peptidoglycan-associated lipoprotein